MGQAQGKGISVAALSRGGYPASPSLEIWQRGEEPWPTILTQLQSQRARARARAKDRITILGEGSGLSFPPTHGLENGPYCSHGQATGNSIKPLGPGTCGQIPCGSRGTLGRDVGCQTNSKGGSTAAHNRCCLTASFSPYLQDPATGPTVGQANDRTTRIVAMHHDERDAKLSFGSREQMGPASLFRLRLPSQNLQWPCPRVLPMRAVSRRQWLHPLWHEP